MKELQFENGEVRDADEDEDQDEQEDEE